MSGLFGLLKTAVGGVTCGVIGGTRCALGYADGSTSSKSNQEDSGNSALDQRVRVDQILSFFEKDFDRFEPYVEDKVRRWLTVMHGVETVRFAYRA